MRALHRPAVALPTLTTGAGASKARKQREDPAERLAFPDHWNEPDVRGALYAMHGRVCAYCLTELTRSDRGDVEHVRPKSLYFWLAYAFENYVLSCGKCNRIFKRDHYPLAPGADRVTYERRADLPREARLFLDPVADPVEEWLTIEVGDLLYTWQAAASLTAGSTALARVTKTAEWFHWNDDPDLVRARTDAVDEALFALQRGDLVEARRCASRFQPHGGAVRAVLRAAGRLDLMPPVGDEVAWLLEDLLQEWRLAVKLGGDLCEKKLRELAWAFAVLWAAPPPGADLDVGAWLADAGLRRDVEPHYRAFRPAENPQAEPPP